MAEMGTNWSAKSSQQKQGTSLDAPIDDAPNDSKSWEEIPVKLEFSSLKSFSVDVPLAALVEDITDNALLFHSFDQLVALNSDTSLYTSKFLNDQMHIRLYQRG